MDLSGQPDADPFPGVLPNELLDMVVGLALYRDDPLNNTPWYDRCTALHLLVVSSGVRARDRSALGAARPDDTSRSSHLGTCAAGRALRPHLPWDSSRTCCRVGPT